MTRNNALRALAWVLVFVLASVTPMGTQLQMTAAQWIAKYQVGDDLTDQLLALYLMTHPDVMTMSWWAVFVVLTLFAIYLGKVFVGIWGESPAPQTPLRGA